VRYGHQHLFGPRTFLREVFDLMRKEEGEVTAKSMWEKHGKTRTIRAWQTALTRLKNLYFIEWRKLHPNDGGYLVYRRIPR